MCSAKHIRAYFIDGKLPEEGTLCDVSEPVFRPSSLEAIGFHEDGKLAAFSGEDVDSELREAVRALSRDTGIIYGYQW